MTTFLAPLLCSTNCSSLKAYWAYGFSSQFPNNSIVHRERKRGQRLSLIIYINIVQLLTQSRWQHFWLHYYASQIVPPWRYTGLLVLSALCTNNSIVHRERIDGLRRKHLSSIMSDQSSFSLHMDNSRPVPRPWTLRRRSIRYRQLLVDSILILPDISDRLTAKKNRR